MLFLPWLFLALGAGLIARAIVPKAERPATWVEVMLIGTAGTVLAALVRQQVFNRVAMPDGWKLLFAIVGAALFAFASRLVKRRSRKPLLPQQARGRRAA